MALPELRTNPTRRRPALLALAIAALSAMLSAPAALYLWKYPDLSNALSLALTLGFFAAFFVLVRNLFVQFAVGIAVLAMNLVEIVHIAAYGDLISLGGIEAILYVDPLEAREFAFEHAGLFLAGAAVVALFVGVVWWKRRLDHLRISQRLQIAVGALVVPFALLTADLFFLGSKRDVFLPTRIVEHYASYLGVNPLTHTASGFLAALGERRELLDLAKERDRFVFRAIRAEDAPDRATYVLVIGESSRSRNWSLYGYGRATNPYLAREPQLIVFRDALSAATTTGRSLPLSFSFATAEEPELLYRTPSFLSAFRETGFKTFWLTNQGTQRTAVGNQIALIMGEADQVRATNYGFWNGVLDEALLPELDAALADPAPLKLIVVHTLGSHTNYRQRFPAGFTLPAPSTTVREAHGFKAIDDAEAAIIDDYDKTIAYTDRLLHEIIERGRARDVYGAVVYFSDHGQRLYDDARLQKGHGFAGFKRQDAEIPLLIWPSDSFARQNSDRLTAIRRNAALPVSTANLAASMLDLAEIRVQLADPALSFFGPLYRPAPRKVLTTDGKIVEVDNGPLQPHVVSRAGAAAAVTSALDEHRRH